MADNAFSKLTSHELKVELARRGAKLSGRKSELLQRLRDYDRNQDFRSKPLVLPAPVLVDWPSSGFRQLDSNFNKCIPPITIAHIEGYFTVRMGIDQRAVGDSQALTKGKLMLDSNRVEACSYMKDGSDLFLSSICRAAMKKGLSYSLKAKIGGQGEVINAHCECPSGIGPHGTCKHVAALLLGVCKLRDTGNFCGINQGCTDQLQSFHKPVKKYGGSPVKAEDFPGGAKADMSDPRPLHLRRRVDRHERMRNAVINYAVLTASDITARYAFPGERLQVAALDHDYLDAPFTEHIVLRRISVTQEQATAIEQKTRLQSDSGLWFEEREWRLTASRFGEIMKMTDRRDKQKLCGSLLNSHNIRSAAIAHGKIYEKVAIAKFMEEDGKMVQPCGLFIDPDHPHLAATPDGLVGEEGIVEVKCPYTGRENSIKPGPMFPFLEVHEMALSLKRSHSYFDQVQGQLFITKRLYCYFIVYTNVDMQVIKVDFDSEYCEQKLVPTLKLFYDGVYLKYIASQL